MSEKTLLQTGAVLGQPQVFDALMEAGQDLLLFPGGAYEALKPKSQQYTLQWKERYGFVRQAASQGYTIVPVALVGPDEFYGHLLEGEQILNSRVGELLIRVGLITESTRTDMIPPVPLGLAGSLLPKPQRCYFQFGKAVDLSTYAGKTLTTRQLHTIRARVATRIESMLEELVPRSAADKAGDGFLRRILTR